MRIHLLNLKTVRAFCDTKSHDIYLNINNDESLGDLAHELAHVRSGDADHGQQFQAELIRFGYDDVQHPDLFRSVRKRIGIPQYIAANVGNVTGIQNILLDYHLLQAYRKASQKILGTEGHWEVINETVGGDTTQQLIRLYPTPKGVFPVLVLYTPVVTQFRSATAKKLCYDAMLAEVKIMVGNARKKLANLPGPGGGNITTDGESLATEGREERAQVIQEAINLGEPLPIFVWSIWWTMVLASWLAH